MTKPEELISQPYNYALEARGFWSAAKTIRLYIRGEHVGKMSLEELRLCYSVLASISGEEGPLKEKAIELRKQLISMRSTY